MFFDVKICVILLPSFFYVVLRRLKIGFPEEYCGMEVCKIPKGLNFAEAHGTRQNFIPSE